MKKMLTLCLLSALALAAQMPLPGPTPSPIVPRMLLFPPELQKYLELSNAQAEQIVRANNELNVFVARRNMRAAQVHDEIREWTGREPIDAMQLGVRYAELEAIRREIADEEKKTSVKVRGVLNPAQLAKIKVLEEAVKLQPLIQAAVCENLMTAPRQQIIGTPGEIFSGVTGVAGGVFTLPGVACVRPAIFQEPLDPAPRP